MYQISILEPSASRRDDLIALLEADASEPYEACSFSTIADFEAYIDEGGAVDILIANVSVDASDSCDGIDLVQRRFPAGSPVQVIYVANTPEYATHAYRTQHIYFLIYPIASEDFVDALDRAFANARAATNRPFAVRADGRVQVIYPRKISYIESDRRKLRIHVGSDVITTYATLDSVARSLPTSFVRSHKSFLVNMGFIESVDPTHVTLFSGEVVPVSQKRRKATAKAFDDYMSTLS